MRRRLDEPKLDVGDRVELKDGTCGIVIARYTPSGHRNEIRYVVRVEPRDHQRRKS